MKQRPGSKIKSSMFEKKYKKRLRETPAELNSKNIRLLLPLKSNHGLIHKSIIEKSNGINEIQDNKDNLKNTKDVVDDYSELKNDVTQVHSKAVAQVQLLAYREEKIKLYRYKIGLLSSEILENPEKNLSSMMMLLKFMEERNPEVFFTVRKLAAASLLEIFKDILPSYSIASSFQKDEVKLKKDTLQLKNYEVTILKYYKQYLQKLEKMANILKRNKHEINLKKQAINLGIFAVNCMTNLLNTQMYFNYSTNIAHYLIPLLNNKFSSVRKLVANSFAQVFQTDKRGNLSLTIVQYLNRFIKKHQHFIHSEMISILLNLQIKDINLDKEKEDTNKLEKLNSRKRSLLASNKKAKRYKSKLDQIENEMLETKSEENKSSKTKVFSEITCLVFSIYFHVLKQIENKKVLAACLEGLINFADVINIDFYQDLVNNLDKILNESDLALKERLLCIHAISKIASNQITVIDPIRLYTQLYKNMLEIHVGTNSAELLIFIKILLTVLIRGSKNLIQNCRLAFIKRMCTMTLNLQHNLVLGIINIINLMDQRYQTLDILLDTDFSKRNSIYLPEIDNPECCNARCTNLWEVVALQRHYHPAVQNSIQTTLSEVPVDKKFNKALKIFKESPDDLYKLYDPSKGVFKPTIHMPKNVPFKNTQNNKLKFTTLKDSFTYNYNTLSSTNFTDDLLKSSYFNVFDEWKKIC